MLAYTQMRGQVLSSTVPAHRMFKTLLIVFAFMDAGMHPDAGSSALKYRACAENASDVTHSFQILGCRPVPRSRVKWSQVRRLRTECVRLYSSFLQFGMLAYTQMRGQVLSSTVPAHRMCQTFLIVFVSMGTRGPAIAAPTQNGIACQNYCTKQLNPTYGLRLIVNSNKILARVPNSL